MENKYDIVVAGGGMAGVTAALAAARQGMRVLVIEKESLPGGLATLGLVTIFLPLCDGEGKQVVYGIGEELLRASIRYGYEDKYPEPWLHGGSIEEKRKLRFEVQYNPNLFAIEMERKLLDEKVDILYDTRIVDAICSVDGRMTRIMAANKSGMFSVEAEVFIDCTGDADLFAMAGVETDVCEENNCAAWYYRLTGGKLALTMLGVVESGDGVAKDISKKHFSGTDGFENSRVLIESHQALLKDFLLRREREKDMVPVNIASILQVRKSRKIRGAETLVPSHVNVRQESAIGSVGDWRRSGCVYDIPYGALFSERLKNVLTAGRSISVEGDAWEVTRVIPACCVTGEAAGIAAAIAVRDKCDVQTIDPGELQQVLKKACGTTGKPA